MNSLRLSGLRPVSPPRFVSPRNVVPYHDLQVQALVLKAFGGLLPQVRENSEDEIEYFITSRKSRAEAEPIDLEVFKQIGAQKLVAGWSALQKISNDSSINQGLRTLLHNFRLPDPGTSPDFYRAYKDAEGSLHPIILWAYERPSTPFIPIKEAIAALIPISDEAAVIPPQLVEPARPRSHKAAISIAAIAAILCLSLIGYLYSQSDKEEKAPDKVAIKVMELEEPTVAPTETKPALPTAVVAAPEPTAIKAAATVERLFEKSTVLGANQASVDSMVLRQNNQ